MAICAGAVVAYAMRSELRIGYTALWIVAISAMLNFAAFVVRDHPPLARLSRIASPVIGVGSWSALIWVTNGLISPFIPGLWLEIMLSAMTLTPTGIILVTAACATALCVQQLFVGLAGWGTTLALQSGFIVLMGAITFLVTRRWTNAQHSLTQKHAELGSRLETLTSQLEDERAVGRLAEAESIGRLAHGLKNAVHSLRGFASLIEPKVLERSSRQALEGLRAAIDDLENLARLTLEARNSQPETRAIESDCAAVATVEQTVEEISASDPGVHWEITSDGTNPRVGIPSARFREVLLNLLRNAVEAMQGRGHACVTMSSIGSDFSVAIRDQGAGLTPDALSRIFRPGYTTKPEGAGFGLFLAHRIVREHGGQLTARPNGGRGAVFELTLPVCPGASQRAPDADVVSSMR
jgi:signal transduction histidine kinase